MPRLPGLQLEDAGVTAGLSRPDRRAIARALGETLAELRASGSPVSGAYDPETDAIQPFARGHDEWLLARILGNLALARGHTPRLTTARDEEWVEGVIAATGDALREPFEPRIVMPNYKDRNVVVERRPGGRRVRGVFDLMGGYYGDGEAALSRQVAMYLEREPPLAREFLQAYLSRRPPRPGFAERFPLYVLEERLAIWEWAQRERTLWWDPEATLREWCEPFNSSLGTLLSQGARRG